MHITCKYSTKIQARQKSKRHIEVAGFVNYNFIYLFSDKTLSMSTQRAVVAVQRAFRARKSLHRHACDRLARVQTLSRVINQYFELIRSSGRIGGCPNGQSDTIERLAAKANELCTRLCDMGTDLSLGMSALSGQQFLVFYRQLAMTERTLRKQVTQRLHGKSLSVFVYSALGIFAEIEDSNWARLIDNDFVIHCGALYEVSGSSVRELYAETAAVNAANGDDKRTSICTVESSWNRATSAKGAKGKEDKGKNTSRASTHSCVSVAADPAASTSASEFAAFICSAYAQLLNVPRVDSCAEDYCSAGFSECSTVWISSCCQIMLDRCASTVFLALPSCILGRKTGGCVAVLRGNFALDTLRAFEFAGVHYVSRRLVDLRRALCNSPTVTRSFADRWINTVGLRQVLAFTNQFLYSRCVDLFNFLNTLRGTTVSSVMTRYMNGTFDTQRKMLIAMFMTDDASDIMYLGMLILDLVRINAGPTSSEETEKEKEKAGEKNSSSTRRPAADVAAVIASLPWYIRRRIVLSLRDRDATQARVVSALQTGCFGIDPMSISSLSNDDAPPSPDKKGGADSTDESFLLTHLSGGRRFGREDVQPPSRHGSPDIGDKAADVAGELSYESRIYLLKAPASVKRKACEKLREIQSRSGSDSQVKAQAFLDGLLRIPFGVVRKEPIMRFLSEFRPVFYDMLGSLVSVTRGRDNVDGDVVSKMATQLLRARSAPGQNSCIKHTQITRFFDLIDKHNPASAAYDIGMVGLPPVPKSDFHFHCAFQDISDFEELYRVLCAQTIDNLVDLVNALKQLPEHGSFRDGAKTRALRTRHEVLSNSRRRRYTSLSQEELASEISRFVKYRAEPARREASLPGIRTVLLAWAEAITITSAEANADRSSSSTNDDYTAADTDNCTKYQSIVESARDMWRSFQQSLPVAMQEVRETLDACIYAHEEAKSTIEQVLSQWITGKNNGDVLGFEGPPGVGKTSLAKHGLTKCLRDEHGRPRPFGFIALGGSTNGATLEGHSYTYMGSTWGRIVDIIMESECMNPIIFLDELDKVSATEHGREIISILTHITDPTQNADFCDKYFSGIKIDLSKVLFVFSYNDPDRIDPVLKDRIRAVHFHALSRSEKVHICRQFVLPEVLETVGLSEEDISVPSETIEYIIDTFATESGVRRMKECVQTIVRKLNSRYLCGGSEQSLQFPVTVTIEMLRDDLLSKITPRPVRRIHDRARVGVVNGLYASASGCGGLVVVECHRCMSEKALALTLTGNLGDIMKESSHVAATHVYNLLSAQYRTQLQAELAEMPFGLHLHSPDNAIQKEGPSAGCAIALAILSCLSSIPVNNRLALTGEIDLRGNCSAIGGLNQKIAGARAAGASCVFFPQENEHDFLEMVHGDLQYESSRLFDGSCSYYSAQRFSDILPVAFGDKIQDFLHPTPSQSPGYSDKAVQFTRDVALAKMVKIPRFAAAAEAAAKPN